MALFGKPKYSTIPTAPKPVTPAKKKTKIEPGMFIKCNGCNETVHKDVWKKAHNVCPYCSFHGVITASERIALITEENSFQEIDETLTSVDVLNFGGIPAKPETYAEKIEKSIKKLGKKSAVICGTGKIDGKDIALAVMDFSFMGASMGSVVGEKITRITEFATKEKLPLVIVISSGGARMQEGALSLMQMAKTSGALERHSENKLPYIAVLTDPTFGGVTASFASLGDVIIAEPKALIGFAGPRVIKDTTQAILPEGFQRSEFLLEKGLIDRVVERASMKKELSLLIEYLSGTCYSKKEDDSKAELKK